MATSGESSVDPVKEETPKETPEPSTAEGEQQKDAGKEEVTPKATSEAETAGGDTQQKEEASESRPKSASPEPELGKRPSTQECKRIFKQVVLMSVGALRIRRQCIPAIRFLKIWW